MKLILLGGLSGAGKTVALDMLEDLGYHVVDNLPLSLITQAVETMLGADSDHYPRLAIGIDPRNSPEQFHIFSRQIQLWREQPHGCTVLYLFCDAGTLIKRYRETRRRHPLTEGDTDLAAAIARENDVLEPLAQLADVRIDTTHTNIHQLREMIRERITSADKYPLTLLVESFGYRVGLAQDADLVFDMRCLPNPYWEPALRELTGLDRPIIEYLEGHNTVIRMLNDLSRFLIDWVPLFAASNRSYLTIALGCTGGRHRSVYMTEQLGAQLALQGWRVLVRHRELDIPVREIERTPD